MKKSLGIAWMICMAMFAGLHAMGQKKIAKTAKRVVLQNDALTTAHVGISIYEPATNKYWYDYQGEKYFVPASNTKIPTCYAAMKYLGDSITGLRYDDTNPNELTIVGTGDPSFLHPDFNNHRVIDFIKQSKAARIILGEPVLVTTDNEYDYKIRPYGSGWTWSDYAAGYMPERSFFPIYGDVARFTIIDSTVRVVPSFLRSKLVVSDMQRFAGFDIDRLQWSNQFAITPGSNKNAEVPIKLGNTDGVNSMEATLLSDTLHRMIDYAKVGYLDFKNLKRVRSQATDSLLKPMMHRSDNFYAEQCLLMISSEWLGVMNERRVIDSLLKTDLSDLPQKPRWVDGSGLSRYNLFSPRDMIAILGKMKNEFGMSRIKKIFPTGGTGTISSYYKSDSGYIYAKTGTLSGVVALSGFLETKKGKQLIFSVLVNNHQASATEVRRAVEKFLQMLRQKY